MAQRIRQLEIESRAAQEEINLTCLVSDVPLSCFVPASLGFVLSATLAIWLVTFVLRGARKEPNDLEKQMCEKTAELVERITQLSNLDEGVSSVQACDTPRSHEFDVLDADFSFRIFDQKLEQGSARILKIKSPGVHHNDVVVDVLCNGCVVTVLRKPSQGVEATTWVKRFQFRAADGWFDLRDDQVTLDGGFLTLVFRVVPSRVFRFASHFDMSAGDIDDAWLYSDEGHVGQLTDPSVERASQALRLSATEGAVCKVAGLPSSSASSSDGVDKQPRSLSGSAVSSAGSSSCDTGDDFEKVDEKITEVGGTASKW